jgi:ketosteroid isomerase-like protein
MNKRTIIAAIGAALVAGCAKSPTGAGADDEAALRALDAAYVEAWLRPNAAEQKSAVLGLFESDAVVMADGGYAAVSGREALEAFWFPDGAATIAVTRFEHEIMSIDVASPIGAVAGRYALDFTFENGSTSHTGHFLFVAGKSSEGWRIRRMIWNVDA